MLLREMTSSALAPSFKRFARLAVAGLALAGLAACGGGGSSTPATTPMEMEMEMEMEMKIEPPEDGTTLRSCFEAHPDLVNDICYYRPSSDAPCHESRREGQQCPSTGAEYALITECVTGTNFGSFNYFREVEPSTLEILRESCESGADGTIAGRLIVHKQPVPVPPAPPSGNSYGSLAFATAAGSYGRAAGGYGDSRSAARSAALAACSDGGYVGCREVVWFQNACGSVALSADSSRAGVGWGTSNEDAAQKAIAACSAAGGQSCRVATSINNRPFEYCVRSGSSPASGQASSIPPRTSSAPQQQPQQQNTYVSISYGTRSNPDQRHTYAWGTASGTSALEAELDARSECQSRLGSRCSTTTDGYTGCVALAISECTGECLYPAVGIDFSPTTRIEAEHAAVLACRSAVRPDSSVDPSTCVIAVSSETGRTSTICGSAVQ